MKYEKKQTTIGERKLLIVYYSYNRDKSQREVAKIINESYIEVQNILNKCEKKKSLFYDRLQCDKKLDGKCREVFER